MQRAGKFSAKKNNAKCYQKCENTWKNCNLWVWTGRKARQSCRSWKNAPKRASCCNDFDTVENGPFKIWATNTSPTDPRPIPPLPPSSNKNRWKHTCSCPSLAESSIPVKSATCFGLETEPKFLSELHQPTLTKIYHCHACNSMRSARNRRRALLRKKYHAHC